MTEGPNEHLFVTTDRDKAGNTVSFKMIEDEWGDIFWAYHHVVPRDFIEEVNRWLRHVGVDDEGLINVQIDGPAVKHLWARMKDNGDRFDVVAWEASAEVFPVTRLMI